MMNMVRAAMRYEGPNDEFIHNLALWAREQHGEVIGIVGRDWHRCHWEANVGWDVGGEEEVWAKTKEEDKKGNKCEVYFWAKRKERTKREINVKYTFGV